MELDSGLQRMKKIEIVIEMVKLEKVIAIIDEAGASGYTIISAVAGRGTRGRRAGGALTDVFKNAMVVTVVDDAGAEQILRRVGKLIQNFAGMAVVTDVSVLWPDYRRDVAGRPSRPT
jgi:nitrogen regulatory protein PII